MAGRKGFKLLLWIMVVAVVLILVVYATVLILLPKDKIIAMIIPKIEEALNREVTVGDVSVSIWGGIGLRLSDLAVKNPGGFKTDNLMELDDLDVKVKFFPLFRKRIEITNIVLDGLTINLERTETGITNFSDLGSAPAQGIERIEAEQAAAVLPFSFDDLALGNSSLYYTDDSSGFTVTLERMSLKSTLVPEENRAVLRSRGELLVGEFSYSDVKEEYRFASLELGLTHDLLYDTEGDSLRIDKLDFSLDKLKGIVAGVVTDVSAEAFLDLSFRTDDLRVGDLLNAIPRELLPQADDLAGSGKLHVVADYRGPTRLTRTADLEGKLTMKDIELAHEEFTGKLEMKLAELNFSETNLTFFTGDAELAGEPFRLKLIVDNIPDPSLSAEVDVDLNLRAVKQFLDPEDELSGRLKVQATAYGKLKTPESMSLLGSLELKNLEYHSKDLGFPVKDVDAEFEFIGRDVRIGLLQAVVGESDFTATGEIRNLTPYLFAPAEAGKKPLYRGEIISNYLDIDELMYEEEEDVSGLPEGGAADTVLFFLPDFDAEGTFTIRSGIYSLVAFEDATGRFELTDYVLHIDGVTAEAYDGDITGSAVIDIENIEQPEFQVDYSAEEIDINSFLSRFTGFQDHLFGEVDMTGSFSGTGSEIEDVLPTLAATGACDMRKGKLVNFDLIKKLAEPIGFKTFDEEKVRDLVGSFHVDKERVYFDDLNLTTSSGDWKVSGSVGFDGSLDYSGEIALSSDAARNLDFLGDFKSLFQDRSGKIVLPFKLLGTYSSPQIALDTSPMSENVDNKLKDEGKELLDKLFKK